MNESFLIFGGTTEGRQVAEWLRRRGIPHAVSVATKYGEEIEQREGESRLLVGRMTADEMAACIREGGFTHVIDATHPFAVEVSREIAEACGMVRVPCFRVVRETGSGGGCDARLESLADSRPQADSRPLGSGTAREVESGPQGSGAAGMGDSSCDSRPLGSGAVQEPETESVPQGSGRTGSRPQRSGAESLPQRSGTESLPQGSGIGSGINYVDDLREAADRINEMSGAVLLLTGSRDLAALTAMLADVSRVFVRVLPNEESLRKCREAGFSGRQIIAMQGPFSKEMNAALIRETGAKVILTKESGRVGGLAEKLEAAAECGAAAIVLRNPEKRSGSDAQCYDMEEILEKISSIVGAGATVKKEITLAGVGPGDERFYTKELLDTLRKADIIFGARSVVERLPESVRARVQTVELYRAKEILEYLVSNKAFCDPLVVFSGDISLCSGAKRAATHFEAEGFRVKKISGISSVSLFANRLGIALEETTIVSSHGRHCNVTGYAMQNEKTIVLTGGSEDAAAICTSLPDHMRVTAGCDLGTDRERIFGVNKGAGVSVLTEAGSVDGGFTDRTLLYIENSLATARPVNLGLSDDDFLRGAVPMTKEEVRALSIRKLQLHRKAVLYDVGAGTGSISIEAALVAPDIEVFSIEKDPGALELLRENVDKFHADNVHIVEGTAPEAMRGLPAPTHVFVGGSSGGMKQILETVMELNRNAKIVINCVTPETLSDVMTAVKELLLPDPEIVQIMAGRYKKRGSHHLPQMMSPVYVVRIGS